MSKVITSKYEDTLAKKRSERAKHITRKKNIVRYVYNAPDWYEHDGQYSKNKVHCSCWACRSFGTQKHSLTLKTNELLEKEKEYKKENPYF